MGLYRDIYASRFKIALTYHKIVLSQKCLRISVSLAVCFLWAKILDGWLCLVFGPLYVRYLIFWMASRFTKLLNVNCKFADTVYLIFFLFEGKQSKNDLFV